MTLVELREQLGFLYNNNAPISLSLYFVIENQDAQEIKRANIEPAVSAKLLEQFKGYLNSKIINNDNLEFSDLTEADDRTNTAYYYDLAEKPEDLSVLSNVLQNEEQPAFNFQQDNLSSIKAFIILIGNNEQKIALYKKQYPINYLRRDSVLRIFPAETRFEKLDKNILSINETAEFLQINNDLVVLNLKVLEKYFGYEQVVRNAATVNLELIANSELLVDVAPLITLSEELKHAKKILRIKAGTPVLQLEKAIVLEFIQHHPVLKKKIKLNEDNSRIDLHTKVSQELFIKLLNDDFLKSELTSLLYDSQSKSSMIEEEE